MHQRSVNKYTQLVKIENPGPVASRMFTQESKTKTMKTRHLSVALTRLRVSLSENVQKNKSRAALTLSKYFLVLPVMVATMICAQYANAQVYVKTSYISSSRYHDTKLEEPNSSGSASMVRAGLQLPLSMKADTIIKGADTIPSQTVWAARFDGSHTRFDNKNMEEYDFPSGVNNYRAGVVYMHTLNRKWSVYSTLGVGVYTASSNLSATQIIGEGALIFIKTIRPNLKVGAGVAFDNTFGFPMVYPGIIVDWAIDGKNGKYFARLNSNELKAGMKVNDNFQVYLNFDVFGASALYKDKMFTHVYYAVGITPEIKLSKYFSMPIMVGITASRNMYAHNRTLTDFFSYMTKDSAPHFGVSPYVSVGISYGM